MKTTNYKNYECFLLEKDLIKHGFEGNGCGSSFWNIWIAKILMYYYQVDFSIPCLIHDATRNRPKSLKSEAHRIGSDTQFHINCIQAVYSKKKGYTVGRLKLADRFTAAVLTNSYDNYWFKT